MGSSEEIKQLNERLEKLEVERRQILVEIEQARQRERESHPIKALGAPLKVAPQTPDEKIALFLNHFRTRGDVFPVWWEQPHKNRSGYSPACSNEWIKGVCDKPRVKCSECPNQAFLPLDEHAVRTHLEGKQILGVYSIDREDCCRFLAADFDGDGFDRDALAYKSAASEIGVDVAVERSRSGRGAHAWIFFSEPVPAAQARRLGTVILSKVANRNPLMRLESYDRFFPNQDTLPSGGFGNLIALPLQRKVRQNGNSLFVDEKLQAFDDQWGYLASVRRLSRLELREILVKAMPPPSLTLNDEAEAELTVAEQALDPVDLNSTVLKFDGTVDIEQTNVLKVNVNEMPARLVKELRRTATFANPKFFELRRMRFSTWGTPRFIFCGEVHPPHELILPRGVLDKASEVVTKFGGKVVIRDQRPRFKKINIEFKGSLRPQQEQAVADLSKKDFGVLVAPPGAGKTVMGCALIAKRKVPTLILVHRAPLLEQWVERVSEFLGIEPKSIGKITGAKKKQSGVVDIAMLQSLSRMEDLTEFLAPYGLVIVDECHHIPASSFEAVLKQASARYIVGLTATPYRKDGHQRILHMQAGPIRHEMKLAEEQPLAKRLLVRETAFRMPEKYSERAPIHEVWEELTKDEGRIGLIADDIRACLETNRVPVVISERKAHLESLRAALVGRAPDVDAFLLVGESGAKERREIISALKRAIEENRKACLFTTGSLIGEGFDLPRLDTLFLAMPVSFKGKVVQYAGRLHRSHDDKGDVRIYDYLDSSSALAKSMFRKRMIAYRSMGYLL